VSSSASDESGSKLSESAISISTSNWDMSGGALLPSDLVLSSRVSMTSAASVTAGGGSNRIS
jgi:hypothetical protein